MCVICHKPANVKFPCRDTIEAMWDANPDGAGVMWRDGNKVKYRKGFMKKEAFFDWLDTNRHRLESTEVAMHFRITTHGGTCAQNCHPFPMDKGSNVHSLRGKGNYVMMHNGIMPVEARRADFSDTAEYATRAKESGNPERFVKATAEFVSEDNRILLFAPQNTWFVGTWKSMPDDDGCKYSNLVFAWYAGYSDWPRRVHPYNFEQEDECATAQGRWHDYYYDKILCEWKDGHGKTVSFEEVDPDALSEADYDIYWEEYELNRDEQFDRDCGEVEYDDGKVAAVN